MTRKRFKKMVYALYVTNRPVVEALFGCNGNKSFGEILKTVRAVGFKQNVSSGSYDETFSVLKNLLEGM